MSRFLSKKLESIVPYKVTLNDAWSSQADNVLKLDWNESAGVLQEELMKSYSELRLNWYPKLINYSLIESLASYCGVSKRSLYYGVSSDLVQENILKLLLDLGDKVLMLSPTYDNFRFSAEVYGGQVVKIPWSNIDRLASTLKSSYFKLCYICNPNNPTGHVMDRGVLGDLLSDNRETLFIVDEAYIEFAIEFSVVDLVKKFDNIIVTRTLSKAYGLAGIRFGYCAGDPSLVKLLWGYNNPKLVSMFTQNAALHALENKSSMFDSVERIRLNREEISSFLKNHDLTVLGALRGNFVLFRDTDSKIMERNLHKLIESGLFIRKLGHIPGLESSYRISVPSCQEDLELLLKRLDASLRS